MTDAEPPTTAFMNAIGRVEETVAASATNVEQVSGSDQRFTESGREKAMRDGELGGLYDVGEVMHIVPGCKWDPLHGSEVVTSNMEEFTELL